MRWMRDRDWFFQKWWRSISSIISRIRYTWKWTKLIYRKVYPWDFQCGLILLETHLKEVKEALETSGNRYTGGQALKSLKLTIKCLERYNSDYYRELVDKRIETEWGVCTYVHEEDSRGYYSMRHTRSKVSTDIEMSTYLTRHRHLLYWSTAMQNKLLKIAFAIMTKHVESWWD